MDALDLYPLNTISHLSASRALKSVSILHSIVIAPAASYRTCRVAQLVGKTTVLKIIAVT